ncbi:hypothetical protein Ciccas_005203 [Cichlidogyrus casuarinus]|uniref:Oxysterol-binding protein n=1 Tax=Cichlidogyrus casuarinus TaxID=1844966 RepID=A0ABD2Q9B5_9PLAT
MTTLILKILSTWSNRIVEQQKCLEEEKRKNEHLENLNRSFSNNLTPDQEVNRNIIALTNHFWCRTSTRSSTFLSCDSYASTAHQSLHDTVATIGPSESRVRRKHMNPRPNIRLHLWSFIKNVIGKDLTQIPLPVHFNEPLSALQRVTEDLTYSALLDKAAECGNRGDHVMQLAYFAAFTVSIYSQSLERTTKPFNPLLGETYELDRATEPEWGWRSISEQVSHHPPIVALHAESIKAGWQFNQEFAMKIKFRGKYIVANPKGWLRVAFADGSVITWNKVTTCLQNVIIGKLWIDHYGSVEIRNHTNGYSCELTYVPYSRFSKDNHVVKGVIRDASGNEQYFLSGFWDRFLGGSRFSKENSNQELLWKALPPRKDAAEIYYFSDFSVEMNELESGVAPTDSRLRPDQRLMEDGFWDEANEIKEKLENRQRNKSKGSIPESHSPKWFQRIHDPYYQDYCFITNRKYWDAKEKQDWSTCPDIFSYK